jgi:hypothetical protein
MQFRCRVVSAKESDNTEDFILDVELMGNTFDTEEWRKFFGLKEADGWGSCNGPRFKLELPHTDVVTREFFIGRQITLTLSPSFEPHIP